MSQFYSISEHSPDVDSVSKIGLDALDSVSKDTAGYVFQFFDEGQATEVLTTIRQHENPEVYLRPVVILSDNSPGGLLVKRVDKSLELDHFETQKDALFGEFQSINDWISKIPNNDGTLADQSLRFKLLRFVASRAMTLSPTKTVSSLAGFEYCMISAFLDSQDTSIEGVLSFLAEQQLLQANFNSRAHFCPHCDSAFLNFKESCPDCGSDNIESDELIHHFKCGHTASINEFTRDNQLICPKCDEHLKHIGVDYDKPSTISNCQDCGHTFQDPAVKADCYSCHRTSDVDDLVRRTIYTYEITALGENSAKFGLDALFTSILQTDLKLYSNNEVEQFINIEKARIQRYKLSQTSVAMIHLENLEQLFNRLGKNTKQMFKELSAVFKAVFRESDLITAKNESVFVVVMTETSTENAQKAIERLDENVQNLFQNSLSFDLSMGSAVADVTKVESLDAFVESALS